MTGLYEWRYALDVPSLESVRERFEQRMGLPVVFARRDREGDFAALHVAELADEAGLQRGEGRIVIEQRRTPTRYFAWQLDATLLDLGGQRYTPLGAPAPPRIAVHAAQTWKELGALQRVICRLRWRT